MGRSVSNVASLVFLLAACKVEGGLTVTPDTKDVKEQVSALLAKHTGSSPSAVACPPEDQMKGPIGHAFSCTATVDDVSVPVSVKLTGYEGLVAKLWLEPTGGLLSVESAEKVLAGNLASGSAGATTTISCGDPRYFVLKAGVSRVCDVTIGDKRGRGKVTLEDDQGNLAIETDILL